MTRFSFTVVRHPHFGALRRPIVPVKLVGPTGSMWQRMVLDSGADFTLLPARLAPRIGYLLPTESSGTVRGVGGYPVPYVAGEIDLEIGGQRYHVRLAWALARAAPAVLGRLDLFREADVILQEVADAITLAPPSFAPR